MCEYLIFSDIDGTLIFSASKKQPEDIVCEYKDGVEISCITPRQAELFPKLKKVIPVTTRSVEQYRRINFPEGFSPKYALVDNGGTLLINGEPEREWTNNSLGIVRKCADELERCRRAMENDPHRSFEIRLVDGMFLFTKSDCPARSLELIKAAVGEQGECFAVGAKLYAVPAEINKGSAAERLKKRIAHDCPTICAGDSAMDIPLLKIADTAVFPEDLCGLVAAPNCVKFPRELFQDQVTAYFAKLCAIHDRS